VLVVYPDGIWYGGVTAGDVGEIAEAVREGKVVERMRLVADEE
jgi:(2Fe-2S) ferredoxin